MILQNVSRLGTLGLITACAASSAFANDRIIGGSDVTANDPIAATTVLIVGAVAAPAASTNSKPSNMSFVQKPTSMDDGTEMEVYICTGSLIAEDIVVTAAHCVVAEPQNLRVVFSTSTSIDQLETGTVGVPIASYAANPAWQGDTNGEVAPGADAGDIALIRLSQPLPDGYHPATLYTGSVSQHETAVLAGYGITSANSQDGAGTLRETQVQTAQKYGKTEEVVDQKEGTGACSGDSGGPAFIQRGDDLLLWGATSRGTADCTLMIYTRIDAYTDWINQTMTLLRNQ